MPARNELRNAGGATGKLEAGDISPIRFGNIVIYIDVECFNWLKLLRIAVNYDERQIDVFDQFSYDHAVVKSAPGILGDESSGSGHLRYLEYVELAVRGQSEDWPSAKTKQSEEYFDEANSVRELDNDVVPMPYAMTA